MKCQGSASELGCPNEAEYKNQNGLCVCPHHKLLLDAFNWETRKVRRWVKIKEIRK